jgi:hypothetical protein
LKKCESGQSRRLIQWLQERGSSKGPASLEEKAWRYHQPLFQTKQHVSLIGSCAAAILPTRSREKLTERFMLINYRTSY